MIVSLFKKMYLIWCGFAFFRKDERAATAIEYALIAAGIALAIVVVVFTLGDSVLGLFQSVETELETSL
ncbi:MAG: Flp family type IVb pilin [Alphaproteobacteria bacterium]